MAQMQKGKKKSLHKNTKLLRSRRVLVAEDNENVQAVLAAALSSMGLELALTRNGLEALRLFSARTFDLVLTDFQMPLMDGSRLAHLIKKMSPETPVILLTGADMATVKNKVEDGSVDSVIFKPFDLNDFQNAVQGMLELGEAQQEDM